MTQAGLRFGIGLVFAAGIWSAPPPRVTVITSSGIEAYAQALEGLRTGLEKAGCRLDVIDLEARSGAEDLLRELGQRQPHPLVAIGGNAAGALSSHRVAAPVFRTMVLLGGRPDPSVVGTVGLNVSPPALLARLQEIFPGKSRLGILRGPGEAAPDPAPLQAQARQRGFSVRVADCAGPEKLLDTFLSLKGQVDFVWCPPDGALFNSATVKPLVLASLTERLPLIGFSESFLRAGAAVALYPDFHDIGLQTAELVLKFSPGQKAPGDEYPRTLRAGINQRVLRLMGVRPTLARAGDLLEVK